MLLGASTMSDSDKIKQFARDVLGCGCPDEVFDRIECRPGDASSPLHQMQRITIGGRLLIHIFETDDPALVEAHLPSVMAAGRDERDRRGLNRFRAVIATDHVDAVRAVAQRVLGRLEGRDDKMHLHVVDRDSVADL